jgi:hypothetical protein
MRMLPPSEILARAGGVPAVPGEQVVRTARLIAELGFRSPVVVDAAGRIVQGAARVLAAERLGIAAIAVWSLNNIGKRLARAAAEALGLPFVQVFEDRLVGGGSSHPQRSARCAATACRRSPWSGFRGM